MVSNIAWKDGCPHYLPASDIWLISEYHCQLLEQWPNGPDLCLDSPDFVKAVNAILDKGYQLLSEMRPEEWNSFATLASPLGYYKRLLLRAIGSLAGVLGDYSDNPNDKDRYYGKAEVARQECAKIIGNDNPSPLDHNNLADLYQQRNQCKEAHEEINRAIAEQQSFKDPMFYNTRAMIYWRENKYLEGMFALEEYRDADAKTPSTSATDVVQFVDNQILAAKLAVASDPTCSAPYWALATTKLENVRRFINVPEIRQKIETNKNVAKCLIEIDDLLGYAYMQQPGWEVSALEVFDRLESVGALAAPGGMGWQRRLKSAKNLARLARLQRRSCSSKMAAKYREQASNELTDSEVAIKQLPLDNGLKVSQRIRNLTVRLDTVTTMIDVAEETFSEGAFKEAQLLLEKMDPILLSLRSSLESDLALQHSLGDQLNTIRSQILLSEAQRSFLHGRILIGLDPSFGGADLIPKAEDSLNAARGVNPNLDCGIDLVLGQMMLTVALAGKGDAQFWYRRAVTFLELAVTRDAPSFRAEAIKALADAYAKRSVVLRKATSKASASAKTP
jgi:tetratricopeptide (TPR) repeat protein